MDVVFVADGDGRKIGINRLLVRELRVQSPGKVAIIFDYNHQVVVRGVLEEVASLMSAVEKEPLAVAGVADGLP